MRLVANLISEVTTPNKVNHLDIPSLVTILSLVNLLGIVNYVSGNFNLEVPAMVESSSSTSQTRDLFSSLLGSLGSLQGGGGSDIPALSPQNIAMVLNLLSSLNKKKAEDSPEPTAISGD